MVPTSGCSFERGNRPGISPVVSSNCFSSHVWYSSSPWQGLALSLELVSLTPQLSPWCPAPAPRTRQRSSATPARMGVSDSKMSPSSTPLSRSSVVLKKTKLPPSIPNCEIADRDRSPNGEVGRTLLLLHNPPLRGVDSASSLDDHQYSATPVPSDNKRERQRGDKAQKRRGVS
ncbi:hypothetical protein VTK73DRAFT_1343 [Phialemonium thermophilum]|uniref:Uncharacterized protein n=1 Tax=Phialemonium thermophilum TaxID=223376 RepID=A0ABR3VTM9_9PEZI